MGERCQSLRSSRILIKIVQGLRCISLAPAKSQERPWSIRNDVGELCERFSYHEIRYATARRHGAKGTVRPSVGVKMDLLQTL